MLIPIAFAAHPLVHLNAALNSVATLLLVIGYMLIKRGKRSEHGWVMLAAFLVSCLFLASYLVYHWEVGSVKFTYQGVVVRTFYLSVLLSHVVLAMTVPFLAPVTIIFGLVGTNFGNRGGLPLETQAKYLAWHRRLARWTFPIWLYVSVTGVVVYVMLYHLWPPVA